MDTTLLPTKLYQPQPRGNVIVRQALLDRLEAATPVKLILVSAPAGYGKTTLITSWLQQRQPATPVCWLALDADDNDPRQLFRYLAAAVAPLLTDGATLPQQLQANQVTPRQLMHAFLQDIAAIPTPFLLVLDDYHVLETPAIDDAVGWLIENSPPQLTLVLTSRSDPSFPLARLRVAGELLEIRAHDLRFSVTETGEFLQERMQIALSADQVAALEMRTEGWIAGLQMAALSLRHHPDAAAFIDNFAGSHRFVMDYLLEEVLQQQSSERQQFLLQTSILTRLSADLCDTVCQTPSRSQAVLETLDNDNLFLIPLDNDRRWYRYHHLFADLLQQRLRNRVSAVERLALHRRAAHWYAAAGQQVEAFVHATQTDDLSFAQQMMFVDDVPLYLRDGASAVLAWFERLPASVFAGQPELSITYGSALTFAGNAVQAEAQMQLAEAQLLRANDTPENRDLLGQIAAHRIMLAITHNDVGTMFAEGEKALQLLAPTNIADRTTVTWALGYAHLLSGDRQKARDAYSSVVAHATTVGNTMFVIGATISLAQVQLLDNEHHAAVQTFKDVIELAGDPPLPPACEGHLGLARVYYEWNELTLAQAHAELAHAQGLKIESVDTPAACRILQAQIYLAQGDDEAAAAALADARAYIEQNQFAHMQPVLAAARARLALLLGETAAAVTYADGHDLPLTQARLALARQEPAAAIAILEPYQAQMAERGWHDMHVATTILLAVAQAANGAMVASLDMLEIALGWGNRPVANAASSTKVPPWWLYSPKRSKRGSAAPTPKHSSPPPNAHPATSNLRQQRSPSQGRTLSATASKKSCSSLPPASKIVRLPNAYLSALTPSITTPKTSIANSTSTAASRRLPAPKRSICSSVRLSYPPRLQHLTVPTTCFGRDVTCLFPYLTAMKQTDTHYQIKVEGQLPASWQTWFDGMEIVTEPTGHSLLCGVLVDQAALYGVLKKIRDLGLTLVSLNPTSLGDNQ